MAAIHDDWLQSSDTFTCIAPWTKTHLGNRSFAVLYLRCSTYC